MSIDYSEERLDASSTLTLDSLFTQRITVPLLLQTNATVSIGSTFSQTLSTTLAVTPSITAVLSNFSDSYDFNSSLGLQIYPVVSFPECPNLQSPVLDFGCMLLDNNASATPLTKCRVPPNVTQPGL